MRFSTVAFLAFIAYINTQALAAPTRAQNNAHVDPHGHNSSHDNGHHETPHDSSDRQRGRQHYEPAPASAAGATDPPQVAPPAKRDFQEIRARGSNLRPTFWHTVGCTLGRVIGRHCDEGTHYMYHGHPLVKRDLEEIEVRDLEIEELD